ncbi:hypothetical protein UGMREWDR_CDS0163 [Aeromonas phage GomatiRiver_11]|nr:hypothetical protein OBDJBBDK_00154 [Aeromonas phage AhFM11]WKW84330.1 hypothetical protein UGMREWDR_CDS0163 [Aeromonas phage GomatiRiver_11]
MIYPGQKYRITKPVRSCHTAKVGDIIEVSNVTCYGVSSMDISLDYNDEPYNSILMFEGPYTLDEYWEKIGMCLEAV